jgi:hypothetical protein
MIARRTQMAVDAAIAKERNRANAVREAEAHVRPWTGELKRAFDSVEAVYRHTLKIARPDRDYGKVHPDALRDIVDNLPRPGAKPHLASDSTRSSAEMSAEMNERFERMFPGAKL